MNNCKQMEGLLFLLLLHFFPKCVCKLKSKLYFCKAVYGREGSEVKFEFDLHVHNNGRKLYNGNSVR